MDSKIVSLCIQGLTVASVILGIGLVVWELRQQREFAESQQILEEMNQFVTSVQSTMGENVAGSLARACDSPDSLTTEDMIVLQAFYLDVYYRIRKAYDVEAVTSLRTYGWKRAADGNFPIIFSTEFGLWWWEQTGAEPELLKYGNRIRDNLPTTFSCSSHFESYKKRRATAA